MRKILPIFFLLVLITLPLRLLHGEILRVDGDVEVSGDGLSWTSPFRTIHEAISNAKPGDEIWVKKGSYELDAALSLSISLELYGGFGGWEFTRDQRNWVANETVIDGLYTIDRNCFIVEAAVVIDGFVITRGNAIGTIETGGGIYVENSVKGVFISNCMFNNNNARFGGGILCSIDSSVDISSCIFYNNSANLGGAVFLANCEAEIRDCTFDNNSASGSGAALFNEGTSNLSDCIFQDNNAVSSGGAIVHSGSVHILILNCRISENRADVGGGIVLQDGDDIEIINCVFDSNSAESIGGAASCSSANPQFFNCSFSKNSAVNGGALASFNSYPNLLNCILWRDSSEDFLSPEIYQEGTGSPTLDYCNIDQDGFTGGDNIRQNPLWVGSSDFHLQSGSPCIDAGHYYGGSLPPFDFEGDLRELDGDNDGNAIVDMGADEYVPGLSPPSAPENPYPANGEIDILPILKIYWDESVDATSYDVYFGILPYPPYYGSTTTNQFNLPELNLATTYHWVITAKNAAGVTPGGIWSFTTRPLPEEPYNPVPSDDATDVSINPQLTWLSGHADSYDVYFGSAPSPPFVANTTSNFYEPPTLNTFTTYYWRIVAKSICGEKGGMEWSFQTGSGITQYILTLATSTGGTTDPTPGDHIYAEGTPVEIDAFAESGYQFSHWIGDVPASHENDNPLSLTIDDNKSLTANFVTIPYPNGFYIFDGHDFDGDGTSDVSVWRPSNGRWYIQGVGGYIWGTAGDIPVNGDYNGDGTTDVAVWRPSNGKWYIKGMTGAIWGTAGDIPAPGNYDGDIDGTTEIAVWRPSNGRWYIKGVGGSVWGTAGDMPVPGDYDGDGTTDIAVWRPSNGRWYIKGVGGYVWGIAGDIPVPGDYNGDGKTDIAVWRPSNGRWYIKGGAGSVWGTAGDLPTPGDYNGDGITDIAVWRPSSGRWYIRGIGAYVWGILGDIPLVR